MEINEENKYQWIEDYLESSLDKTEKKFFEEELEKNPPLKVDFEEQRRAQSSLEAYFADEKTRLLAQKIVRQNKDIIDVTFRDSPNPGNNPLSNFRFYLLLMGLVLPLLFLLFYFFWKPDSSLGEEKKGSEEINDTVSYPPSSPEIVPSPSLINEDGGSASGKDSLPVASPQSTIVDTSPQIDSIIEIVLGESYGFGPSNGYASRMRRVLKYSQAPESLRPIPERAYLFDDTLRIYGSIDLQTSRLLFYENESKYKLKIRQDTFTLFRYEDWQNLRD